MIWVWWCLPVITALGWGKLSVMSWRLHGKAMYQNKTSNTNKNRARSNLWLGVPLLFLDRMFLFLKKLHFYLHLACLRHSDYRAGNLILSEGSRWCELDTVEARVNVDWKCRSMGGIGLRGGGAQKVRALGGSWQDWVVRGDMASSPHLVSCS